MKSVLIRYGLIAGATISVLMLISMPLFTNQTIDYGSAEVLGYVSILLSLSTIFIAVKTFRDKHNDGKVKFGKAFLIGLYISLIAGGIYALTFVIVDALSATSFMEKYRVIQLEIINKMDIAENAKQIKIEEMDKFIEMYKNPIVKFLFTMMVEYLPVGIIVSLIAALILKKK